MPGPDKPNQLPLLLSPPPITCRPPRTAYFFHFTRLPQLRYVFVRCLRVCNPFDTKKVPSMSANRPRNVFDFACYLLALGAIVATAQTAHGADFRVENSVFSEEQKQPISRSTTVFYGGAVYDFMQEPEEVIIFDKASGHFDVLDMHRHVRVELSTAEVVAFSQRLKERTEKSQDPLIKFLGTPTFEQQFDEKTGDLTFTSPLVIYRVRGKSVENQEVVQQSREFSNWLAQLNLLLSPGARPPFSRLQVNEALAKHNMIAQDVQLTTAPKKAAPAAKQSTVRSQHRLEMQVTKPDFDRIQQVRQSLASFKRVSFEEYRHTPSR
jgi:hypothetical protein